MYAKRIQKVHVTTVTNEQLEGETSVMKDAVSLLDYFFLEERQVRAVSLRELVDFYGSHTIYAELFGIVEGLFQLTKCGWLEITDLDDQYLFTPTQKLLSRYDGELTTNS